MRGVSIFTKVIHQDEQLYWRFLVDTPGPELCKQLSSWKGCSIFYIMAANFRWPLDILCYLKTYCRGKKTKNKMELHINERCTFKPSGFYSSFRDSRRTSKVL
ncbi:hypothetical protein J5N97_010555 [Dioscorea zingiberensis]|uniref:Uncharacterized protein n=1 Tax=Dioscorea zingiberensis TaxID=325984 RepID=A0A9D5D1G4_9LILI|nr:hypothetical protein J5N97_010555 [Dioscorea zingiberensis]